MCVRGASVLQNLLAEFPDARLRVLVVWEPVIASDVAAPLTPVLGLLHDLRVIQYWDPDRVVSGDFVRTVNDDPPRYGFDERLPPDFVAWDAVAVFSRSAAWRENPPVPVYFDGPVKDAIDGTRTAITDELTKTPEDRP